MEANLSYLRQINKFMITRSKDKGACTSVGDLGLLLDVLKKHQNAQRYLYCIYVQYDSCSKLLIRHKAILV